MTVAIATMGLYGNCRSVSGAPPYRQNADEIVKPRVLVHNVEMVTKNSLENYLDKIKVKLVSFDE